MINGALVAGCTGTAAIGASYLLARRDEEFETARLFVATGVVGAAIFSITQVFPTGDENVRSVVQYQPANQAAYEGLFASQYNAPIAIIGFPSTEQHKLLDAIEVPGLLSYLTYGEAHKQVPGMNAFRASELPPVQITDYAHHIFLLALLLSVAAGNVVNGVPLNAQGCTTCSTQRSGSKQDLTTENENRATSRYVARFWVKGG